MLFFLVGANMKLSRIHKKSSENEINCVSHTITLVSCHCLSACFPEVIFFLLYTVVLFEGVSNGKLMADIRTLIKMFYPFYII